MEKFHLLLSPPHTPQLGRGISQNGNGLGWVGLGWVERDLKHLISHPAPIPLPGQGHFTWTRFKGPE